MSGTPGFGVRIGMLRLRSDDHFVILTAPLSMTGDAHRPC